MILWSEELSRGPRRFCKQAKDCCANLEKYMYGNGLYFFVTKINAETFILKIIKIPCKLK